VREVAVPGVIVVFDQGNIFDVVKLARENNIPSLLPTALFECVLSTFIDEIFQGARRSDGSLSSLSREDQEICILGWWKTFTVQAETTFSWLDDDTLYNDCSTPTCCPSERTLVAARIRSTSPDSVLLSEWDEKDGMKMCKNCATAAKESHNEGREAAWQRLPSIFDLSDWDSLAK
jgi:hypothetical protein